MTKILSVSEPSHLFFAKKPLRLCTPEEIQRLPVSEINAKMREHRKVQDFEWTNNIYAPGWQLTAEDNQKINDLLARQIPSDSFVICFMNHQVGYGVYLREPVKKGSIIIYAGEMKQWNGSLSKYVTGDIDDDSGLMSDAERKGNHSSLFQDLYPPFVPLSDLPQKVARNNFEINALKLSGGRHFEYLEATSDIEIGEQAGVPYGIVYWNLMHLKENIQKEFFWENGNLISEPISGFLRLKVLTKKQVQTLEKPIQYPLNFEQLTAYIPADQKFRDRALKVNQLFPIKSKTKPASSTNRETPVNDSRIPNPEVRFVKRGFLKKDNPIASTQKQNPLERFNLLRRNQIKKDELPTPQQALQQAAQRGNKEDMEYLLVNHKIVVNEEALASIKPKRR